MLFTQHLYDDWEELPQDLEHLDQEELMQKTGSPFYDIALSCSLDEATGHIIVLAINGHQLAQPVQL
jgi:hypothetical protein